MSSVVGASPEAEAALPLPQPLLSTNDRSMGCVVGVVVVELLLAVGFDFGNGWGDIRKQEQVEEIVIVTAKKKYNAAVPATILLLALCPVSESEL